MAVREIKRREKVQVKIGDTWVEGRILRIVKNNLLAIKVNDIIVWRHYLACRFMRKNKAGVMEYNIHCG